MEIIIKKQDFLYSDDTILKLKKKEIHIVCPAIIKISYAVDLLINHLNVSYSEFNKYCEAVNAQGDPGCLYPKYSITLFPIPLTTKTMEECINEVMKANEQYFKTSEMIIAFDNDYNYNNKEELKHIFKDEIEKYILKNNTTEIHLKKCYFIM